VAHTISALRQYKQSEIRRARNHALKSALRTQIKKVLTAVQAKDATASKTALVEAYQLIDRAISKGVVHKNTGGRQKSRLAVKVNAVAAAPKK
jgi:small subunit ribosomal protein S20